MVSHYSGAHHSDLLYDQTVAAARLVIRICGGVVAHDRQHVPRSGGVLLAANHRSLADPPLVAITSPRRLWFLAQAPLLQIPILGSFIRRVRAFPVQERKADRAALRTSVALLRADNAVLIFPEGSLRRGRQVDVLAHGIAFLAVAAEVPIVPVGIVNADLIIPYASLCPRPMPRGKRVHICFSQPVDVSPFTDLPPREGRHAIVTELRQRMQQCLDQAYQHAREDDRRNAAV